MTTIKQVRTDAWPTPEAVADLIGLYFCDKTTINDAVPMADIFKAVYGYDFFQTYECVYKKDLLKRAMHTCRKRMRPFVVPIKPGDVEMYFAPTTSADMKYYRKLLREDIAGCNRMITKNIPKWLKGCSTVLAEMQAEKLVSTEVI